MDNSNIPSGDDNVKIYNGKNNEMQLKFCHGPMKQFTGLWAKPFRKSWFKAKVQGRLCKKDDYF